MAAAGKRLATLKRLLQQLHDRLQLRFGIELWDGTTIPASVAPGSLVLYFADEGTIASLIRRPSTETLCNLGVSSRIDIKNGTLFDIVDAMPVVRTKKIHKLADQSLLWQTALKFLFVPRGGPWPLESIENEQPSDGSVAENKKNIGYHYDVSNDFYALWLDPELIYTCSYFTNFDNSLEQAQLDKLEMVCRRLRLKPGETLLDVGCGWGALSCYAAKNYGVKVYGVTLSEQQVAYANEKVRRLGLQDLVHIDLKDFSHIEGEFDKVASIGMLDHVGIDNFPTYFETMRRVLKPDGLFLNHHIVRPGRRTGLAARRKPPEFAALTKYIFPGGELDSISGSITALEKHGFEVHDVEGWREHYQRTCRLWHDRLYANREAAISLVGEVKYRLWLVYLGGCSISFQRNNVGIYQTLASRRKRGASGLPPTRADLYRNWPAWTSARAVACN
jgi:cyclopropane-fatty-acyl-phospholipid synthase